MEFMLNIETEFDYNAEIITLRKTNIERIEKQIASIRSEAEERCDDVALQLHKRKDTLTASTNSNIEKLTMKKGEDLKALMSRLARQQDFLCQQEEEQEHSADEDIASIVASLRKNVSNIQKAITGRDAQLDSDCQALRQQLETDAAEMEALANLQCTQIRKQVEGGDLAHLKAVLRLERYKLTAEELTAVPFSERDTERGTDADTETGTETDTDTGIRTDIHPVGPNKKLSYSSPTKKSPTKRSPSSTSSSSSPSKNKTLLQRSFSSPVASSSLSISTPMPRKKTGHSTSAEAARKVLLEEQQLREDDRAIEEQREVSTTVQFQKSVDIVARYHSRGGALPRDLKAPTPSSSPEQQQDIHPTALDRDQECKDFINLNRWKQSLRGGSGDQQARAPGARCNGLRWFGFCPDEVRDYLDEHMPAWRDSRWRVDLRKSMVDDPD